MRFWIDAIGLGAIGVIVTFASWLAVDAPTVGVVSMGQIMITLAIVGCSFMLLAGLHSIGEILQRTRR